MRCVMLQYNWAAIMGRVILRGSQSPALLDEMKRITIGEWSLVLALCLY